MNLPKSLLQLIDELAKLPGIGKKTAKRLAFSLLLKPEEDAIALAKATLDPGSTLQERAIIALDEVAAAARSLKLLTDYLERHPEALLQGKGKQN